MVDLTPFQTVGPYFALLPGLASPGERHPGSGPPPDGPDGSGRRVLTVTGAVRDGEGRPVPDALLEVWQSAATRVIRAPTDADGEFVLRTLVPEPLADDTGALHAPHLLVGVLARGLLGRLVTRIYFPGEPTNATDPVLAAVPEPRRATLIAGSTGPDTFRFEIVLQGAAETVFFDV